MEKKETTLARGEMPVFWAHAAEEHESNNCDEIVESIVVITRPRKAANPFRATRQLERALPGLLKPGETRSFRS